MPTRLFFKFDLRQAQVDPSTGLRQAQAQTDFMSNLHVRSA